MRINHRTAIFLYISLWGNLCKYFDGADAAAYKEQSDNTGPIKIINKSRAFYGRSARGGIYSVNPLFIDKLQGRRIRLIIATSCAFLIMTLKAPKIKGPTG
jgi:hypothetical protein